MSLTLFPIEDVFGSGLGTTSKSNSKKWMSFRSMTTRNDMQLRLDNMQTKQFRISRKHTIT